MTKSLKILLIAPYACSCDVGEAWSTYQWLKGITDNFCDVTILSLHKKNKNITSEFPAHRVVSWEELPFFPFFERFNAMLKPSYPYFYWQSRLWIKRELKKGQSWDIIHQLAPLALRYPCPVWNLGIPYIMGPLAGSISIPHAFQNEESVSGWFTKLRGLDKFRIKKDFALRKSYENSSLIIGVAPYVKSLLSEIKIKNFSVMNETGILKIHEKQFKKKEIKVNKFQLLFVGRVVRTKGVRDLIRAVGILKRKGNENFFLNVLGDGDDRPMCEKEAKAYMVDDMVKFHGRVQKEKVFDFYKKADAFVFPSFKEPSGNVVLEAMSFGLPMIVCDQGGPGYTVKDSFGIKLRLTNPAQYADDLAESILRLANNPALTEKMGCNALEEAKIKHLWPQKIDHLTALYKNFSVLNEEKVCI